MCGKKRVKRGARWRAALSLSAVAILSLSEMRCAVRTSTPGAGNRPPEPPSRVLRRYPAPEASQAVAVDAGHFYAIGNAAIGKYEKATGRRIAGWQEQTGGHIAHLNSGIVVGRELYCAHSNYPELPMESSIEVFDTARMTHARTIPLPAGRGSATWIERAENGWWVTFAHYAGKGGEPGKGPEATTLVRFDAQWRPERAWSYPASVVSRWDSMSSSGGVLAGPRRFLTTGHHATELYVLDAPESGSELQLHAIVPIESEGQGIAFDRDAQRLYSIQRRTREVLVSRLKISRHRTRADAPPAGGHFVPHDPSPR